MHVNSLLHGLGAGFSGPRTIVSGVSVPTYTVQRSAPAPAPAPTAYAPQISPGLIYDPNIYRPTPSGAILPEYDTSKILTREQIQDMIRRAKAAEGELEARQTKEGGDGIAEDLEQAAAEDAATEKAVTDAAGGTGLPGGIDATFAEEKSLIPLMIAGVLIFFMRG